MSKKNYYRINKEHSNFINYLKKLDCDNLENSTDESVNTDECAASKTDTECEQIIDFNTLEESELINETDNSHILVNNFSDKSDSEKSTIELEENNSNGEIVCENLNNYDPEDANKIYSDQVENSASSCENCDIQMESASLSDKLKNWYNEHNVTLEAFRGVLKIFHPFHPELPLDPRTILRTKSAEIQSVTNGEFVYFGLINGIKNNIRFSLSETDTIKIDINIDGVPIFKSCNTSFWPILCSTDNSVSYEFNAVSPFIVAIFYGSKKPDVHQFLQLFVEELKIVMDCGIEVEGKQFDVELRSVIADAPARAFLKQTKCHGGYYACDRCTTKGKYKNRAVSYSETDADKRDNISFRAKSQPEHHIGDSPFTALNIDMVNVFVYDYLHVILLGIVRKLMSLFWNKVPFKISVSQKSVVEQKVKLLHKFFPSDFARKPRSFDELERFKGSEFRTLLFYTGFIIFQDILPSKMYNNFCILIFIVKILCDPLLVDDENNLAYAQALSISFVKQFKTIYRDINVSFNVHSLIHMTEDVRRLGVLDSFSAFPYESVLGNIKRKIRTSNAPLAQISRRISEGYKFNKASSIKNDDEIIICGHKIIPSQFKNSFVLLHDKTIASVKKISGSSLKVHKYQKIKPLLKYPTSSSLLDMHMISISLRHTQKTSVIKKNDVLRKCMILPYKKNYAIIPLI